MTKQRAPKVMCFGEALWDCLPDGRHLGGSPLNVAYHLSKLGCSAWLASSVGDDSDGLELLRQLDDWATPTEFIGMRSDKPTGLVNIAINQGLPTYHIVEDVAWDYIDLPKRLPDHAKPLDAIVYGSLALRSDHNRASLRQLCEVEANALRVFDVNLRPPFDSLDLIWSLMREASLIKLNDEEVVTVLGLSSAEIDFEANTRELSLQTGCKRICITAGAAGAGLLYEGTWHWIDAVPVNVRDTVGAGDSFLAALVQGLLVSPEKPNAALQRAVVLASFVAGSNGATPSYRYEDIF